MIVLTTARLTGAPITALTMPDNDDRYTVSAAGMRREIAERSVSICTYALEYPDGLVIGNATTDSRLVEEDLVTNAPRLRSYAGVPVHVDGRPTGTLCVLSTTAHHFGQRELELLRQLGGVAEQSLELEARRDVSTPPSAVEVERLADRIASGEDRDDVMETISRPAVALDRDTLQLLHVNTAAVERYGWSLDEFRDRTVLDLRPPEEAAILAAGIRESNDDEVHSYWNGRHTLHWDRSGHAFPVALRLADFDEAGARCRLVVVTDLSAHRALSAAVEQAANYDPLTTFGNRRLLLSKLNEVVPAGGPCALILVDLDYFKSVNDAAGHVRGDELLVAAAARFSRQLPRGATPARYGGDTFAAVVPDIDEHEMSELADGIRASLAAPFRLGDGGEFRVTASVGLACTEPDLEPTELLARADDALEEAKQQGRNRVCVAGPNTRDRHRRRGQLGHDLRGAIDRDELELWFQPIVRFDDGEGAIERAEALIRWRHPTRGMLPPGEFLPILEESGLMPMLNRAVLDKACAAVVELRDAGRRVSVSVNCSAAQFHQGLVDDVDGAIEAHGASHSDLRIEVTETAFGHRYGEVADVIEALAERSLPVEIDDFGAGHSSLGRLASLPIQGLKLDAAFVRASTNERGREMLRAVFALAHAADLPMTAEGIETPEQLEIVREIGFPYGQGFLFGRPSPLGELPHRIDTRAL